MRENCVPCSLVRCDFESDGVVSLNPVESGVSIGVMCALIAQEAAHDGAGTSEQQQHLAHSPVEDKGFKFSFASSQK